MANPRQVVSYYWQCDRCGATEREEYVFGPGEPILRPSLPDGWTQKLDRVFCGKHEVTVILFVDGRQA